MTLKPPSTVRALEALVNVGWMRGYTPRRRGYRVVLKGGKEVDERRYVVFDESVAGRRLAQCPLLAMQGRPTVGEGLDDRHSVWRRIRVLRGTRSITTKILLNTRLTRPGTWIGSSSG